MESRLRMLVVLAGLPEPVVNHIEYDDLGRWVRRFDLSSPKARLAIEYDGRQHAQSQFQWERDVDRREGLDVDGWRLVVVLSKGIYREPGVTLDRVVAAMRACGMKARVRSDEWQQFFPGRCDLRVTDGRQAAEETASRDVRVTDGCPWPGWSVWWERARGF